MEAGIEWSSFIFIRADWLAPVIIELQKKRGKKWSRNKQQQPISCINSSRFTGNIPNGIDQRPNNRLNTNSSVLPSVGGQRHLVTIETTASSLPRSNATSSQGRWSAMPSSGRYANEGDGSARHPLPPSGRAGNQEGGAGYEESWLRPYANEATINDFSCYNECRWHGRSDDLWMLLHNNVPLWASENESQFHPIHHNIN